MRASGESLTWTMKRGREDARMIVAPARMVPGSVEVWDDDAGETQIARAACDVLQVVCCSKVPELSL